jgi:hypothetical protein
MVHATEAPFRFIKKPNAIHERSWWIDDARASLPQTARRVTKFRTNEEIRNIRPLFWVSPKRWNYSR